MMRAGLRAAVFLTALAAAVDPGVATLRRGPLAIDLRAADGALLSPSSDGSGVARQLTSSFNAAAISTAQRAEATVVIGPPRAAWPLPAAGPVSVVGRPEEARVEIVRVIEPLPVLVGWTASVEVDLHGRAPGTATVVELMRDGVAVDRAEHRWTTADERARVTLTYVPARQGLEALTVALRDGADPSPRATREIGIVAVDRQLSILTVEARPSWAAAFVRRALEGDPAFRVVSEVRASRGVEVTAGGAPPALSAGALEPYDAVLVGAAERLTAGQCQALEEFARTRGGSVVFLADRAPSGACAAAAGRGGFEEALLDKPTPVAIDGLPGPGLRASELALVRDAGPAARVLATVTLGTRPRPVIVAVPRGSGQFVYVGALDAWRYRGRQDDGFARAWRYLIATAAAAAPRAIDVTVRPRVAAPGDLVDVDVRLRGTLLGRSDGTVTVPGVRAELADGHGATEAVRLWPSPEPGRLQGRVRVPAAGHYDLRVASGATVADAAFVGSADQSPVAEDTAAANLVASATGGVSVSRNDLGPLLAHLRAVARTERRIVRHPARTWWWTAAFVALACVEWAWRRRTGLR